MLDLRRLRLLVTVAEEGSFTAAAQRLFLTQSAVSQQMAALEREVGVALLRRRPRGVTLNAAGQALVDHARRLLSEVTTIEQEVRQLGAAPAEIRVGAFATAAAELLPSALRAFLHARPDVRVSLSSVHSGDAVARLLDGDLDVLLMWDYDFAPRPIDPGLARWQLHADPLHAVLPADHPLAGRDPIDPAELAADTWVVRTHRPPYADAYEAMGRLAGFEPAIGFRADDYPTVLGLVGAGIGVSLVPRLSLGPPRDDVAVRPLTGTRFARRITVLTQPGAAGSGPVPELLKTLAEAVSAG